MARILIVDDSDSFAEFARAALAAAHEVDIAHNGREAAKLAQRCDYDLVITDIFMPEADGLETLRTMRHDLPHVPVIAMTGNDGNQPDYLRIAEKLGATGTIRKPFLPTTLNELVTVTLGEAARIRRSKTSH